VVEIWRWPKASERGVDGQGGDAEARGGVAVDDQLGLEAFVLLVGGDILELGQALHGVHQARAPLLQVGDSVRGEGVLVLGGGGTRAEAQLLHVLEVEGDAGEVAGGGAQTVEDDIGCVAGLHALIHGLEEDEGAGLVSTAAAEEADGGLHAWVFVHDGEDLLDLRFHGSEAGVLLGADLAAQASRVLLGEEALGDDDVEVDVDDECEQEDDQRDPLVA